MTDAVTEYLRKTAKQAGKVSEVTHVSTGTWVPTFTGFSADPAGGIYRYTLVGKLCTCLVLLPNAGTSNGTGFTLTAPFTAATLSGMFWEGFGGYTVNAGTLSNVMGMVQIASGGTAFSLYLDALGNSWTATGTKKIHYFTIVYEIA